MPGFGIAMSPVLVQQGSSSSIPIITLLSSGTITDIGATVAGTVDNGKLSTVWSIEYGLTNAYGSTASGGTISEITAVSKELIGLIQNTLYHWRIKAVNSKGTTYSADQTLTTTNITYIIDVAGRASGTATAGTLIISFTEDVALTVTGDVAISVVRANDSIYRKHTVTVNCPNTKTGTIVIPDKSKLISLADHNGASLPNNELYSGTTGTSPILTLDFNKLPDTLLKIKKSNATTDNLFITGSKLPTSLIHCYLSSDNISLNMTGALPSLPQKLYFISENITYTYAGSLPYSEAIFLSGAKLNWTGLNIGAGNISVFLLSNYRVAKMSSADMITLLTNLTNRLGLMPASITINDYEDYASPPAGVTTAVNLLKSTKSITTVNLGA